MLHNTTSRERHALRIAETFAAERRKARAEHAAAMRQARELRERRKSPSGDAL